MKLSITQIILGVLIIFAACYITGWMIHEAPHQFTQLVSNNTGGVTYINVVPEDERLFNVSRYGSYALPVLGVLVLIIGTIQSAKADARNRRLIIINIVAGFLIAALAFIITRWGYPTQFHTAPGGGSNIIIFANPGRSLLGLQSASGIMVAFGLAVLGVGIAQLIKARKTQNAPV
jgi:flagellar basal body-associated protein FliL